MLNQAKHRTVLVSILTDIYSDPRINHLLGFKGGTALYLFYKLDRFSVDLDFDLLDRSKEEMVYQVLLEILANYGELKDSMIKHFGSLIAISYEKGLHHLKIDVSNRESLAEYEVKNFLGLPINTMVLKDMAANKLMALTERKKPAARDVFDIHFILKNRIEINEDLIKQRFNLSLVEQIQKAIDFIEERFEGNLLEALGELLAEKQKAWVKNKLKAETLLALRIKLDSLENALDR